MSLKEAARKQICVFDSGVGGLSVLNELRAQLPGEDLIYLGDTARVPYGTKSSLSITRYATQAARALIEQDIKCLVIACNTASAVAVEPLRASYPYLKVIGVVEPGADACRRVTRTNHIAVIATESTINNQAYQKAILSRDPSCVIQAFPCSLFVALAEEGWHEGPLVEAIIKRSLEPLIAAQVSHFKKPIDTLVLGCTHFPALKRPIANVLGEAVQLVDSAETTALYAKNMLSCEKLLNPQRLGQTRFMVTDGPERFARIAPLFFSEEVLSSEVELVDIQHYAERQNSH